MSALGEALLTAARRVRRDLARAPRSRPGRIDAGGRSVAYADLHSFYHQSSQIFGDRLYDTSHRTSSPFILDCGAHIGLASLYFKDRHPGARIHAYEADPAIADLCRGNLTAFGCHDVAVTTAAVWTHDEGVPFVRSGDDAGHVCKGGAGTVPSIRLRSILAAGPVDLLKLDIEGAEFEVIADCGDTLRNVQRLIAEIHVFGHSHDRVGALLQMIEACGFRYVLADLHHATWIPGAETPPFGAAATDRYYFTLFGWRPE